jgi:hypothetical protein
VNLIHGAFYHHTDPSQLIHGLLDNLTWERVEVDMISFSGPAFAKVDNRLTALQLVEHGLTEAAMFTAEGEAVQWAELLYKKPVLVQRGSFRPITNATLDVLERVRDQFVREPELKGQKPVVLMEMTLRLLTTGDAINHHDFLQRADTLRALGQTVLISNFRRFHRLVSYLARYTSEPIGLAIGAPRLPEIFDGSFYNDNEGGLLGGLGQLFRNHARLYVYPSFDFETGRQVTVENFAVAPQLKHLYAYLTANRSIVGVEKFNREFLRIRSRDVLDKIAAGDRAWEKMVPPPIVEVIKAKRLFGWGGK